MQGAMENIPYQSYETYSALSLLLRSILKLSSSHVYWNRKFFISFYKQGWFLEIYVTIQLVVAL